MPYFALCVVESATALTKIILVMNDPFTHQLGRVIDKPEPGFAAVVPVRRTYSSGVSTHASETRKLQASGFAMQ